MHKPERDLHGNLPLPHKVLRGCDCRPWRLAEKDFRDDVDVTTRKCVGPAICAARLGACGAGGTTADATLLDLTNKASSNSSKE